MKEILDTVMFVLFILFMIFLVNGFMKQSQERQRDKERKNRDSKE